MSYTSRLNIDTAYHINNADSVSNIQKVDQIKDLGILYDSHLTFKDHIQEQINKAYSMIGLIKRNFIHMDHCESKKLCPFYFYCNFSKCWPILIILSVS